MPHHGQCNPGHLHLSPICKTGCFLRFWAVFRERQLILVRVRMTTRYMYVRSTPKYAMAITHSVYSKPHVLGHSWPRRSRCHVLSLWRYSTVVVGTAQKWNCTPYFAESWSRPPATEFHWWIYALFHFHMPLANIPRNINAFYCSIDLTPIGMTDQDAVALLWDTNHLLAAISWLWTHSLPSIWKHL